MLLQLNGDFGDFSFHMCTQISEKQKRKIKRKHARKQSLANQVGLKGHLSDDDMEAAGVNPSYVRLSIGIEHIDDIIEDLKNALDAA